MPRNPSAKLKFFPALALALVFALGACMSLVGTERIVQTIEVAPTKVVCVALTTQECLQVRVLGSTQWEYFYGEIEGFVYEPGFTYVIIVERSTVKDPPQNGSGYRFRLVELVSKTPVE